MTDNKYDNIGRIDYWWSHSIISDTSYKSIMSSCDFSLRKYPINCYDAMFDAYSNEFGDIDEYSIYTPSCKKGSHNSTSSRLKNTLLHRHVSGYDPCIESYAEKYFNRPDVQHAMHANDTGISYKWTACRLILYTKHAIKCDECFKILVLDCIRRFEVLSNWNDSDFSMLPTYKKLIAAGRYRIWIFR